MFFEAVNRLQNLRFMPLVFLVLFEMGQVKVDAQNVRDTVYYLSGNIASILSPDSSYHQGCCMRRVFKDTVSSSPIILSDTIYRLGIFENMYGLEDVLFIREYLSPYLIRETHYSTSHRGSTAFTQKSQEGYVVQLYDVISFSFAYLEASVDTIYFFRYSTRDSLTSFSNHYLAQTLLNADKGLAISDMKYPQTWFFPKDNVYDKIGVAYSFFSNSSSLKFLAFSEYKTDSLSKEKKWVRIFFNPDGTIEKIEAKI